ncbi:MAG: VOC family protein [Cyclobacteriaceae bacterium]
MFLITACLFPNQKTLAQSLPAEEPSVVALNHVALYVVDLEVSTTFYRDVLKLTMIPEPFKDGKHTWFSMGGNSELHLISGLEKATERNKHNHLCFSVKSMEDMIKIIKERNIPYSDWPGKANTITIRPDGVKQLYFQDPDGYWIEVNDAFPGS